MKDEIVEEIVELHNFFEAWFRGELPRTPGTFERYRRVMADDFQMVTPSGRRLGGERLASSMWEAHGQCSEMEPPFTIQIENPEVRWVSRDVCVATYDEAQRVEGELKVRTSTVLFQRDDRAPNGLVWYQLHETWLP